ncbi:putative pumilio-like protein 8 [Nymphaea thermarum]|nr:putative pumilio-like protein 8 [Nymphaea thermarum]
MADHADMMSLVYELRETLGLSPTERSLPPVGASLAKPHDSHLVQSSFHSSWRSNQSEATGDWSPVQPHDAKYLFSDFDKAYPCFPASSSPPAGFFSGELVATRPPSSVPHLPQRFQNNFCGSDRAAADGHLIPVCPHNAESLWRFNPAEWSVHDHGIHRAGSAMHANRLTQPFAAPSPQDQATAEYLRQSCLPSPMGQSFRGNQYRTLSPLGAVPWCGNWMNAFHRTSLSSTPPGTISRVGRSQVADWDDDALTKRTPRQPFRHERDELLARHLAEELAKNELKEISRKEEDFSFLIENQQSPMYTSLEEVKGRILAVAKEKHGRQFLESKCKQGLPDELETIFSEIKDHLCELLFDAFGNYLVDSFLDGCNARQRMEILAIVTRKRGFLIHMSTNQYAAKVVRKLIATIKTAEEISLVRLALKPGVLTVMKDSNGHHVVLECLKNFSSKDCEGSAVHNDLVGRIQANASALRCPIGRKARANDGLNY